jgi:hypothetical protein
MDERPAEVARSLALDGMAADLIGRLESSGVREPILLKGASFVTWLYADDGHRPYLDVDLLIHPADEGLASAVLQEAGFFRRSREYQHGPAPHAISWGHPDRVGALDLHTTLVGSRVDRARTVEVLRARAEPFQLAGRSVLALDEPARAFHVVLHAAQDRQQRAKKLEDLRRVLALPFPVWEEVRELAEVLQARSALRAGLDLLPEGRAMAARLGLPDVNDLEVILRASGESQAAALTEHLRHLPSWSSRTKYLVERIWPSRGVIDPDRRTSWAGTVAIRFRRLVRLAKVSREAVSAQRRARRRLG